MAERDDFSEIVKKSLALRVGNLCSNPACRALTAGPHEQADKAINLGVAAHITAAAQGGPRFDSRMSSAQRAAAENGIWLCQNCAKLIDSDAGRFPIKLLLAWKARAEQDALARVGKTANLAVLTGTLDVDPGGGLRANVEPAPHEANARTLLEDLKRLTSSQFDELVYYLGVEQSYLPGTEAALAKRAVELCRLVEQHEGGSARLRRKLDEIGWFKKLLPRGAYPVDSGLRAREEERERLTIERARTGGGALDEGRVSPKQFYCFREQAAWLAVLRNWDAPRSFRSELLDWVMRSVEARESSIAAAIVGPGGSGKSIALRRLGVDLFEQGYKVWWVDDLSGFLQDGLSRILEHSEEPQFVLIDKADLHGDELRRLLTRAREFGCLKFVFAGRELTETVRWPQKGSGRFEPDDGADRVAILRKIAELVPEWSDAAKQLQAEPLRRARLIHVLFAMSRLTAMPATIDGLYESFVDILADDARRAGRAVPGLMEALVDAAVLCDIHVNVDHSTLVMLAERHHSGARHLLEEVTGNHRWQVVDALMEYSAGNTWRFHHDELGSGLLSAARGAEQRLGPKVVVDNAWRRRLLEWIMDGGTLAASSSTLYGLVRHRPEVVPVDSVLAYVYRLIGAGCEHHAYMEIAALPELRIDKEARFALLSRLASVAPGNPRLWGFASRWLQSNFPQEARSRISAELLRSSDAKYGRVSSNTLVPCLKLMTKEGAREYARGLLKDSDTLEHGVVRYCLNILGDEATGEARRLIRSSNSHDVLCACLKLLGAEAKPDARRLLQTSADHEVVTTCLKLLGEEAKDDARRLVKNSSDHDVLCACLAILGAEAKDDARRLLEERHDRYLTVACFRILGADAKDDARRILDVSRYGPTQCLCMRILGAEAKEQARRLVKESRNYDVLCMCLNVLGPEAAEDARRFLASPDTRVELVNRSLAVLGEEATEFALDKLVNWRQGPVDLIACCMGVAWRTREVQAIATEILQVWDPFSKQLRVAALGTPMRHPLRLVRAEQVVAQWHSQNRMLLAAALNAYGDKPAAVTNLCRTLVYRWRLEIEQQYARAYDRHDVHIVKAMSHPLLRAESRAIAREMLEEEALNPGFLTDELKECAEDVSRGRFVPWPREQRSSLRRRFGGS